MSTDGRNELIVYGIVSSRALRVHWALKELGLDYRTERIQSRSGQTLSAEYTRLNPRQKIPVLRDGNFVLSESAAIVTYLGEKYGHIGAPLVPKEPEERARYNEWVSFISMELDATSLYVVRRHEGLPEIYGAAPAVVDSCKEYFLKQLNASAPALSGGQPYLLASGFSGADILMMTCLDWAIRVDISLPAPVLAYRARLADRPAYADAMAANESPEVPAPEVEL